ncbi:DUF4226 domain-containing protein [Mycobacterium sp. E2479]|uniref:DUF4226 domain-containing protein n=1 Tax=Mycobacterium sp. E2479 TaxID=1834134 RepID=UPI0007FCF811|nr:DUF4226 domain-containing protein [Mycobacterium sp. E2479]OBH56540.1 hypothetical protein A5686_00235 [Mycobacterium sp. E2479]
MSAYDDLLAALESVRDRTGDPNAWQTGLTPAEVTAALSPTTRSEQIEAILRKIRQQQAGVLGAGTTANAPVRPFAEAAASPDRESGDAADAIAHAEAALAQQNSASSQLDLQVISAILNAHLHAVDGSQALVRLQHDTEAAVRTRSDLDTPAGARDFQRFLIGKLRDIREVVLNASLDDTSKSALMAAWTSLYDASKGEPNAPGGRPGAAAPVGDAPGGGPTDDLDAEWDPLLDSLLADDGGVPGDVSGPETAGVAAMPAIPQQPMASAVPNFGGGSLPGLGSLPASMAGWEGPGGLPLSRLGDGDRTDPALGDLADEEVPDERTQDPSSRGASNEPGDGTDAEEGTASEEPPAGPTPVTLPDGETVTAGSPALAAVITAALGGTPIAEAFQQQGITIPPPGTAVPSPIDAPQVSPGDIGMLTDRHALALGPGKALLDGQIQHIATVSGPSFLGWEHPPSSHAAVTTPAKPDPPTPTRPATSSTT